MSNLTLLLTTCPAYPPSKVSRIYCFQLKHCVGGAAVLGLDVLGEARGAAHPSGTASIPAGLQLLVFLSSGFYGIHTCNAWFTAKIVPRQPSGSLSAGVGC